MSAVPPLPGLVPALYTVQPVPGTQLVLLAIRRADQPVEAADGLVLAREEARDLARQLNRATGRARAVDGGRGPRVAARDGRPPR